MSADEPPRAGVARYRRRSTPLQRGDVRVASGLLVASQAVELRSAVLLGERATDAELAPDHEGTVRAADGRRSQPLADRRARRLTAAASSAGSTGFAK